MAEMARVRGNGRAVRLTLSARVANDLDGLGRTLEQLAERMGHPACATGCDTLFIELEREFSAGDEVMLNPQPLPPKAGPLPDPWGPIEVLMPAEVLSDIGALRKAVAITVDRLGCSACCSGFDIAFRQEVDVLAFDENLEARGYGRFG
jgi:hypothetical protein